MPDSRRAHLPRPFIIAPFLLAALIIIVMLAVKNDAVSAALAPYFTKEPDPLTELYFVNYKSMPKFLDAGKSYPIDFTVVNHENQNHRYSYRVTAYEGSKTTLLAAGYIFLKDGGQVRKELWFTPTTRGAQDEIVVKLVDRQQWITFSAKNNG
ncbi:MAG: DUF1616 domain-containing protein [Actinobacteria bacterium]|nr:DUF1616 domain-containing protein [Actinomycetota bacterium]